MSKFKSLLNWLKNPKMWFVILYLILSIALITASIVVVSFGVNDFWAYLIYSLTAVDVIYLVYLIIYYVPKIRQACLKFAYKNRLTKEYVDNFGFRSLVSVSFSFAINGVYALFLAVMSIISGSYWYGALAIYYFALTLIRGGILFKHVRRRKIDDENTYKLNLIKSYRNCGIYLSLLTLALSGAIVQMVISNQGFRYAGTMILSKHSPSLIKYDMDEFWTDNEGRTTTIIFEAQKLAIVNAYIPNGNSRLEFKMKYLDALTKYLAELKSQYLVICLGDFNIAHNEIDLTNPKECRNKSVFLPIEREAFGKLLNLGFVDCFRDLYPEEIAYSWRSYRSRMDNIPSSNKNFWKYRIDYIIYTKGKLKALDCMMPDLVYSDHLPVIANFEL